MKKVLVAGVFDILHTGHLMFLQKAKKLGDELIVIVTCDAVAKRQKKNPVNSEKERAGLVAGLKPVDKVIIGLDTDDYFKMVKEIKPDVLVLGHDQKYDVDGLVKSGYRGKTVRLKRYNGRSTSGLKKNVKNMI